MTVKTAKAALTKAEKDLCSAQAALEEAEAKLGKRSEELSAAEAAYQSAAERAADGNEKPSAITKLREQADIAAGAYRNAEANCKAARPAVREAEAGVKKAKEDLWQSEHDVRMAKRQELADAMLDALFEFKVRWQTLRDYDHNELGTYFQRVSHYEAGGSQQSARPLHEGEGMLILGYLIKTAEELTEQLPFHKFWLSICRNGLTRLNEPFEEILRDAQRIRTERMDSVIANGARWTHDNRKMRRRHAYKDPLTKTNPDGSARGPETAY